MTVIKVLRDARAQYIPATGLKLVSSSVDAMLEGLSGPSEGTFDNRVTFFHELIHHVQVLSSSYLWRDSLLRFNGGTAVLFPDSPEQRREAAFQLLRSTRAFNHRAFGISVVELCEGGAVLESFKAVSARQTSVEYLRFRDHYFPGKGNSVYRRTFDLLADVTNADAAFDLLPVLSWLALQGDIPGRSFAMLLSTPAVLSCELVGKTAREIVDGLGFDFPFASRERVAQLHPSHRHPTLYPVLMGLCKQFNEEQLLEAFGRPHLATDMAFFPPLIFGAHRLGQIRNVAYGAGRDSKELRAMIAMATGLLFAAEQVLDPRDAHIPCPHAACPNHGSGLCAGWFTPPTDPELCGLRAQVKGASRGKELHQIAADCSGLVSDERLTSIRGATDMETLFPGAEELDLDEEWAGLAERFDQKFDLDPEDNDLLAMLTCPDCGTMRQEWVSRRRFDAGYAVRCECGASIEAGRDRGFLIDMGSGG